MRRRRAGWDGLAGPAGVASAGVAVTAMAAAVIVGVASPTGPAGVPAFAEGFLPTELESNVRARWSTGAHPVIAVRVRRAADQGTLRLEAASLAVPRRTTFRIDGRPPVVRTIGTGYQAVVVPLGPLRPGTLRVVITTSPGPQRVSDAVPGSADTRRVALRVREPLRLDAGDMP